MKKFTPLRSLPTMDTTSQTPFTAYPPHCCLFPHVFQLQHLVYCTISLQTVNLFSVIIQPCTKSIIQRHATCYCPLATSLCGILSVSSCSLLPPYNLTFRIPSDLMRAFMLDLSFCCFVLALPHILVKKKHNPLRSLFGCALRILPPLSLR
jgi:hypothetical protein